VTVADTRMRARFGDVELDAASRQVWRAGREVHLSPKAFELLALLVERRPAAVPKSEIRQRLWHDTFVSDTNLPTLIAEIRDAIGDDARHPQFVRTVHRFGYAFQGEITERVERRADDSATAWLIGATSQIGLVQGDNVLGREGAGIVALDSPTISRRHAKITIGLDTATVEDLGSKNGTFVNDTPITSAVKVVDGDAVRVGSLVFTFRFARPGSSTQTI
jgi:DNA-binding winged helix-turn-helix (wHTH) protein